MSNPPTEITDAELHAYVDQRLDPARRAEVEAYLEANPDAAARVRDYRAQNDLLRAAFDGVLEEPVPDRLAHVRPRWSTMHFAAIAATMVIGVSVGWFAHVATPERVEIVMASLPQQAAVAHVVYTPEVLHPVEVDATQEHHLVKWLSKRLGKDVQAPSLVEAGFQLEGGRLLPGGDGPAAQFMYRNSGGERLTLYLRTAQADSGESAFRFAQEDKVSVFYWVDRDLAYALSGEIDRSRLLSVAEAVYHDLNP
jgi:anti-sigma factor RsiW